MKKTLLSILMGAACVVPASAVQEGDYVYTPQGRFLIQGGELCTNGTFVSGFNGWNAISATEGTEVADLFAYSEEDGGIVALNSATSEGMYYVFDGADSYTNYVVSMKVRGYDAGVGNIPATTLASGAGANVISIIGNTEGTPDGATELVTVSKAVQLSPEVQEISFAIPADGVSRKYVIKLQGLNSAIAVSDVQIFQAQQVADLRQRDKALEYANILLNAYEWDQDTEAYIGLAETAEAMMSEITDETTQEDLDAYLEGLNTAEEDFINEYFDNYLATCANGSTLTATGKLQKQSQVGDWFDKSKGRIHRTAGETQIDLGHFQGGYNWTGEAGMTRDGLYMTKELEPGVYVFSIDSRFLVRPESPKNNWDTLEGAKLAYGKLYIMQENGDTIASTENLLDAVEYTKGTVSANITEKGTYVIGIDANYAQTISVSRGGAFWLANPQILYKSSGAYNAAQSAYIKAVMAQVETGRSNITTATASLADDSKVWGKSALQEALEAAEPVIAQYETLTDEQIVETFDADVYDSTKGLEAVVDDTAEEPEYYRLLESEVYVKAVKGIIAANRTFTAVNDTLASLASTIAKAEEASSYRIYDYATGKPVVLAAVAEAKALNEQMLATDYSEENAAAIVEMNAKLNAAVSELATTIPAERVSTIIDIDFENAAVVEDIYDPTMESIPATISGNNGTMELSAFRTVTPSEAAQLPFELGVDANGEKACAGVLRIGNGTGTVAIEVPEDNYGTDVVRVSMDWWYVRLTDGYTGFYMEDANAQKIAGVYFNPYQNADNGNKYDPTGLANAGGYVANTTGDAGSCADNNKTHVEYILDFGNKVAYSVATLPSNTVTTGVVEFSGEPFVNFVVGSNYKSFNGRRSWFDNLKIERIAADPATSVGVVEAAGAVAAGKVVKVLENGQLVIKTGNAVYNAVGAQIK